jgi:ribosomal protein S18 acetylase RimI-like enzyme
VTGVRPARPADAAAIAEVQRSAWGAAYADLLPHLPPLVDTAAAWRAAVDAPPSVRHRVLVAVAGSAVVGFAAYAPSGDADRDPAVEGELLGLHVRPHLAGRGHGSRLLTACADLMRADGFVTGLAWVRTDDRALQRFLASAGWAPDGARRGLDAGGSVVGQLRLHTDLGETG